MLITFKTLEQKTFKIEIEETAKILQLKEKIAQERGGDQFPVAGQKLIYSGKILDDDKTITDFKIDSEGFVVVMVVKKRSAPTAPTEPSTITSPVVGTSTSVTTPAEPTSTATVSATTTETTTSTIATTTSPSTVSTETNTESQVSTEHAAESTLLTGSALENSITELMSLGYSREQVMVALNRSYHNADRAAEYLLSGNIAEPVPEESESAGDTVGGDITSGISAEDLSFLRNSRQFQRMRNQVQSNPNSLPMLLQGIGETNPDLLGLINENQEQFISLLNEQQPEEGASPGGGAASGGGGGGGGAPFQISVTPAEKDSIDRIVAMGFNEAEVIQAYMACDKNEQLAVEFLLQ